MYYHQFSLWFNSHFSGGPELASTRISPFWILVELRMTEIVMTTEAIRHANLRSKCFHQQINTQFFYRLDAVHVAQPIVSGH